MFFLLPKPRFSPTLKYLETEIVSHTKFWMLYRVVKLEEFEVNLVRPKRKPYSWHIRSVEEAANREGIH